MGLTATLTVRLDCRSVGEELLQQIAGPAADLGGLVVPVSPDQLGGTSSAAAGIDATPIAAAAQRLVGGIPGALGGLPQVDDVLQPVTAVLDVAGRIAANDLPTLFDHVLGRLQAELRQPGGHGHVALLLRLAELLRDAPEGRALQGLAGALLPGGLGTNVDFPFLDILRGLDGATRTLGGLMALESVLAEGERLSQLLSARLDPRAIDHRTLALRAALGEGAGSLAARLAAVDAGDHGAVARLVAELIAVAAELAALRETIAFGLGMDEATLSYLDITALQAEIDAARAMIRGADVDPARRVSEALATLLQPLLAFQLPGSPAGGVGALIAAAETQVAGIAAAVDDLDLTVFTAPLAEGLATLTAPLREIEALIDRVLLALRSALDQVRQAVAALPLDELANTLRDFLAPVAAALDAVTALLAQIEAALQAAAGATSAALRQVDGALQAFQQQIDGFFAEARDAVDQVDLSQAVAVVAQGVQQFADLLAQAQMKPYFDGAVSAIDAATDVVAAVPFGLLPESMKAEVDAAVAPIKAVDVGALQTQIETTLGITPDGRFALRGDLDAAIEAVHQKFQQLLAVVDEHHPRTLLAEVDTQLEQLAARVRAIEPDLTLQPVRDALDAVKAAVQGIDLDALLAPVRDAFAQIDAALDGLSVAALVAPAQQRIDDARSAVTATLRLDDWEAALDDLRTQVLALLQRADPSQLRGPVAGALAEARAAIERFPALRPGAGLGVIVAALLSGTGRRIQPGSFATVLDWLDGTPAAAALAGRAERLAAALDTAAVLLERVDPALTGAALNARFAGLAEAVQGLRGRVDAGLPVHATLSATLPLLDSGRLFGELAAQRARYRGALQQAQGLAGAFRRSGFSEADVGIATLRRVLEPLQPAGRQVRALFGAIGVSPAELGVNGVLRLLLDAAPPERLVGIVMPVFEALHRRLANLLDAVLDPLRAATADLRSLLQAVDLAPLVAAADGIVAQARQEIQALHPDRVLEAPLQSFAALRTAIVDGDPLAPVAAILTDLRELIARVLERLDLERLLASPLAIYDHILEQVRSIDPRGLLTPVFDQLDVIASQVDTGLDDTVGSFRRLQDALPAGGGGSSVSVSVTV